MLEGKGNGKPPEIKVTADPGNGRDIRCLKPSIVAVQAKMVKELVEERGALAL
jgi:hypothetical protein